MQQVCARSLMRTLGSRMRIGVAQTKAASTAAALKDEKRGHNIDPHLVEPELAKELGATKRETPGEYLHQRGRVFEFPSWQNRFRVLVPDRGIRKELLPVLPLVVMVILAIWLGVWNMYRAHVVHPNVAVQKKRREMLFELEDPEETARKGEQLLDSPLRRLSLHSPIAFVSQIQQEPPNMGTEGPTGAKVSVTPGAGP